jgi:hypothetical protein
VAGAREWEEEREEGDLPPLLPPRSRCAQIGETLATASRVLLCRGFFRMVLGWQVGASPPLPAVAGLLWLAAELFLSRLRPCFPRPIHRFPLLRLQSMTSLSRGLFLRTSDRVPLSPCPTMPKTCFSPLPRKGLCLLPRRRCRPRRFLLLRLRQRLLPRSRALLRLVLQQQRNRMVLEVLERIRIYRCCPPHPCLCCPLSGLAARCRQSCLRSVPLMGLPRQQRGKERR